MDNITADELIVRTAGGDMAALERLYREMFRPVYAFVMTIVRDAHTAEDITQDVFVKVYTGASDFSPNGFGRAWMMRIARNLALNAVSRRRETEGEEALEGLRAPDRPEDSAIARLALRQAMRELTDDERRIITLHAAAGMKLAEIAEALEQPLGTIKWKHASALKKLRGAVGDR